MKKIALISCINGKNSKFNFVKEIDKESQLFKLSLEYSKKIADEVYILTSRYGLIKEDDFISSYNDEHNFRNEVENRLWSLGILEQLSKFTNIHSDEYVILAKKNYYRNYVRFLQNVDTPLENLSIDDKICFLKNELDEEIEEQKSYAEKFHILFNSMKRYNHNNFNEIPFTNGVYVILDKKEKYKDLDRIVRVGTHENDNKLIQKIRSNYKKGSKDSNFFRKDIGKSILVYNKHPYLKIWNINFNVKENQIKFNQLRDMKIEELLDEKITNYMKERFELVCFEIDDFKERQRLEEGLISSICMDEEFKSSEKWLGRYSPTANVIESKMWVCGGMNKKPLTIEECRKVVNLCIKSNQEAEKVNEV